MQLSSIILQRKKSSPAPSRNNNNNEAVYLFCSSRAEAEGRSLEVNVNHANVLKKGSEKRKIHNKKRG